MRAAAEAFLDAGGLTTYTGRMRLKHHPGAEVVLWGGPPPTRCLLLDGPHCLAYGCNLAEVMREARARRYRQLVFAGVDPAYLAEARAGGLKVFWHNPCDFFVRATPIPEETKAPAGFQLGPVLPGDAPEIDAHHPYRTPASLADIQEAIAQRPSAALRTEAGELVAWELIQVDGTIGYLHVREAYRRRGFAWLLGDVLARLQVQSGGIPCARVLKTNTASQSLVSRRMRKVAEVDWFALGL